MAKTNLSNPSAHLNLPEVKNFSGDFFYNFYTIDERVNAVSNQNPFNSPRYVSLTWTTTTSQNASDSTPEDQLLSKLISEDESFSNQYYAKNFSEVTGINNAALNFKNFYESQQDWFDLSLKQKKDAIIRKFEESSFSDLQSSLSTQYDLLTDLPADTLGVNIFDSSGNSLDQSSLLKSMVSSLALNIKIHKHLCADVLTTSEISQEEADAIALASSLLDDSPGTQINVANVTTINLGSTTKINTPQKDFIGYILKRYRYQQDGSLREEFSKIIKTATGVYNDTGVVYGGKYAYSISNIFRLNLYGTTQQSTPVVGSVYIHSTPSFFNISCFEFKPPPPPADIRFFFDYIKRNLIMTWDFPSNSQSDIKQFQIFRRKSLDHPFELIYQYGFDSSVPSYIAKATITGEFEDRIPPNLKSASSQIQFELKSIFATVQSNRRYVTGEKVDANNIDNMSNDLRNLVVDLGVIGEPSVPIFKHVDEDFSVDTENFTVSTFIYAMSAVDAHGMISNYSSQYKVSFDLYKNKLTTELVCDEGSPRAYPNFNLVLDTFKDSINTTGMKLKDLEIYFDPENFQVINNAGTTFDVVSIQKPSDALGAKPFYHLQMINLDNQLTQVLRINVKDVENK